MDFGHQLMLILLLQGQASNYPTLMCEIVALRVDVKHPLVLLQGKIEWFLHVGKDLCIPMTPFLITRTSSSLDIPDLVLL